MQHPLLDARTKFGGQPAALSFTQSIGSMRCGLWHGGHGQGGVVGVPQVRMLQGGQDSQPLPGAQQQVEPSPRMQSDGQGG